MATRIESTVVELDVDKCTLTFGVAPCTATGSPKCYNSFRTCRAKAAFTKGSQTIQFTSAGAPIPVGQPLRPYVSSVEIAATELDVAKGLAARASSTVKMMDETDSDLAMDPYVSTRATPAKGTFWLRLLARNHNIVGRPARIDRAFIDEAGTRGTGTVERFIVDRIAGPDGRGEVTLTLKDPIKLADRSKAPTPSTGKLAVDLALLDTQLELGSGEGAAYASSGFVRVGDEIIRYTSKAGDTLIWGAGSDRATWGTSAAEHSAGDLVQQCLHFDNAPVATVIQTLLNLAGIQNANIDLVQLQAQDDIWLSTGYRITTLISDPTEISTLLAEICQQTMSVLWWANVEQRVKFRVVLPDSPATAFTTALTDAANLIEGSVAIERQDTERVTFVAVYFGLMKATEDPTKPASFRFGEAAVDLDAESANEYGDRRTRVLTSRWFGVANSLAMRTLARRLLARYRDPPRLISFALDPKDDSVREGDLRDIQHPMLVDETGAPKALRCLVTRRQRSAHRGDYRALETNFDRRYAFVAPAGTSNYPSNNGYACVSNASGLMSDGTSGYLII